MQKKQTCQGEKLEMFLRSPLGFQQGVEREPFQGCTRRNQLPTAPRQQKCSIQTNNIYIIHIYRFMLVHTPTKHTIPSRAYNRTQKPYCVQQTLFLEELNREILQSVIF